MIKIQIKNKLWRSNYKLDHQKIAIIRIQLSCFIKVAIGSNLEDRLLVDLALVDRNGKLMREISLKSFHCIFQLFLFRLRMNIICWEGWQVIILECFKTKNYYQIKLKCLHLEISSPQSITIKKCMSSEDTMEILEIK